MRSFNGKCSLKNILPALSPNHSYDQLSLSSGSLINFYYHDYINSKNSKQDLEELKSYAYLDTYSMYIIYQKNSRIYINKLGVFYNFIIFNRLWHDNV